MFLCDVAPFILHVSQAKVESRTLPYTEDCFLFWTPFLHRYAHCHASPPGLESANEENHVTINAPLPKQTD